MRNRGQIFKVGLSRVLSLINPLPQQIKRKQRVLNSSLTSQSFLFSSQVTEETRKGMASMNNKGITRVLFCGPYFPASHNYTKEYLRNYSFIEVDDVPLGDVPDVIENYHLCVVKNMRLDSNIVSRANQMKLIMHFGVGLEGVDIEAAPKCGIKVARIPGDVTGNAALCAELAIYLMLGLLRKMKCILL